MKKKKHESLLLIHLCFFQNTEVSGPKHFHKSRILFLLRWQIKKLKITYSTWQTEHFFGFKLYSHLASSPVPIQTFLEGRNVKSEEHSIQTLGQHAEKKYVTFVPTYGY
jgi:hypothetical protein